MVQVPVSVGPAQPGARTLAAVPVAAIEGEDEPDTPDEDGDDGEVGVPTASSMLASVASAAITSQRKSEPEPTPTPLPEPEPEPKSVTIPSPLGSARKSSSGRLSKVRKSSKDALGASSSRRDSKGAVPAVDPSTVVPEPQTGPTTIRNQAMAPELVAKWEAEQNFTEEQNLVMRQLRDRLIEEKVLTPENLGFFDFKPVYYKFAQARGFNVDKAFLMVANHIEWRSQNNLSTMVPTAVGNIPAHCVAYRYPEHNEVKKAYQFIHHKTAKNGMPLYIDRIGSFDFPKLKETYGSEERFMQYMVAYGECTQQFRLPGCSLAAGKYIGKGVYIIDLEGFKISTFGPEMRAFMKSFNGIFGDNYPETVEKMFVINTPWIFKSVWQVLGPMIDKRTREKITMLTGRKDYLPKLLEWIPRENLPDFFGGTDTSCDFVTEKGPWAEHWADGCLFGGSAV